MKKEAKTKITYQVWPEFNRDQIESRKQKYLEKVLGRYGRMIAGSKSGYCERFPKRAPVFNANLCTENGKIWHGDIDLSTDLEALKKVSKYLKETVFVLYESDARFENEKKPKFDRFIVTISPKGDVTIREELKKFYRLGRVGIFRKERS